VSAHPPEILLQPAGTPGPGIERWHRGSRVGSALRVSAALVVVGILALMPFLQGPSTTYKLTNLFLLVVLASMWNLLAGFGGMITVGLQAFVGIGAYSLLYFTDQGAPPYVGVLLAAIVAAAAAVPMSFMAFRLTGGYFAIGTWVLAEVCRLVIVQIDSLGRGAGRSLLVFNGVEPAQRQANTYWVTLTVLVLATATVFLLLRSRTGLGLIALRDNAMAAESSGVRTQRAKRLVFVLGAAGCGLCGALFLANSLRVQPDSAFSVSYSAAMIFCVIIGGVGSIEGPILGAVLFFVLQDQFADQGTTYLIVIGLIAMVMALWQRAGIWGLLHERTGYSLFPTQHRVTVDPRLLS
jgi:branched-chain amino acid transport system permease protein